MQTVSAVRAHVVTESCSTGRKKHYLAFIAISRNSERTGLWNKVSIYSMILPLMNKSAKED